MLLLHIYSLLLKMDHSDMGHGDMGHGDMGHGDMDMGGKCSMNVSYSLDSALVVVYLMLIPYVDAI